MYQVFWLKPRLVLLHQQQLQSMWFTFNQLNLVLTQRTGKDAVYMQCFVVLCMYMCVYIFILKVREEVKNNRMKDLVKSPSHYPVPVWDRWERICVAVKSLSWLEHWTAALLVEGDSAALLWSVFSPV